MGDRISKLKNNLLHAAGPHRHAYIPNCHPVSCMMHGPEPRQSALLLVLLLKTNINNILLVQHTVVLQRMLFVVQRMLLVQRRMFVVQRTVLVQRRMLVLQRMSVEQHMWLVQHTGPVVVCRMASAQVLVYRMEGSA
jgi:hypothetical protein